MTVQSWLYCGDIDIPKAGIIPCWYSVHPAGWRRKGRRQAITYGLIIGWLMVNITMNHLRDSVSQSATPIVVTQNIWHDRNWKTRDQHPQTTTISWYRFYQFTIFQKAYLSVKTHHQRSVFLEWPSWPSSGKGGEPQRISSSKRFRRQSEREAQTNNQTNQWPLRIQWQTHTIAGPYER